MLLNEEIKKQLIEVAIQARQWSYSPYSNYKVGAALLTSSGKIYDGVNVENVVFPECICAERVAIFKAVSEGEREFDSIVIATENAGMPCGACRQVIAEFGLKTRVLVVDLHGDIRLDTAISNLLPEAFTPTDLI